MSLNLRELRLRLQKLALDIEILDDDEKSYLSLPFHITTELTNIERDVTNEIKRLKDRQQQEYLRSSR